MKEILFSFRGRVLRFLYVHFFKKIVFRIDPEKVHDSMVSFGMYLGGYGLLRSITSFLFQYKHPMLAQTVCGINFENPVGLSAGFDKNARLTNILPAVGFGFAELGSITGEKCEGNPKPRLWRLKKSKSILVHYGLMNDGAEAIGKRLRGKMFKIPVGINIAKTNTKSTIEKEAGAADYLKAYREMDDIGSYVTINISCPNAYGGCPFTKADTLTYLLSRLSEIPKRKPIFVKVSPDLSMQEIDDIIKLSRSFDIDGFICSNLTKKRGNPMIFDAGFPEYGGMSGKVVDDLSDALIEHIYRETRGEFVIIGVGGIFSAEDAYRKIRKGASLVELITGMIYEGPQLIGEINRGLVRLLKRDGFSNVAEAIGVDVK